jgi:preprotein translocase subunit SecG
MWGANKWMNIMIKKYWWFSVIFIIIYISIKVIKR